MSPSAFMLPVGEHMESGCIGYLTLVAAYADMADTAIKNNTAIVRRISFLLVKLERFAVSQHAGARRHCVVTAVNGVIVLLVNLI